MNPWCRTTISGQAHRISWEEPRNVVDRARGAASVLPEPGTSVRGIQDLFEDTGIRLTAPCGRTTMLTELPRMQTRRGEAWQWLNPATD